MRRVATIVVGFLSGLGAPPAFGEAVTVVRRPSFGVVAELPANWTLIEEDRPGVVFCAARTTSPDAGPAWLELEMQRAAGRSFDAFASDFARGAPGKLEASRLTYEGRAAGEVKWKRGTDEAVTFLFAADGRCFALTVGPGTGREAFAERLLKALRVSAPQSPDEVLDLSTVETAVPLCALRMRRLTPLRLDPAPASGQATSFLIDDHVAGAVRYRASYEVQSIAPDASFDDAIERATTRVDRQFELGEAMEWYDLKRGFPACYTDWYEVEPSKNDADRRVRIGRCLLLRPRPDTLVTCFEYVFGQDQPQRKKYMKALDAMHATLAVADAAPPAASRPAKPRPQAPD